VMAATQRPVAEAAFSEPNGPPAWKSLPSWAVVPTADKAAGTGLVRSMAERAGATITEVEGSHVIMVSQPQAVTDVILEAIDAVASGPLKRRPARNAHTSRLRLGESLAKTRSSTPIASSAKVKSADGRTRST